MNPQLEQDTLNGLGYGLRIGSSLDRTLLVKFMERTYRELAPQQPLGHIAATVDRYLSHNTPLWWVFPTAQGDQGAAPIAALWMGLATDQRTGGLHPYILLLYVAPDHRRRGIATALLNGAHHWADRQNYSQITLQVFSDNPAAQALYATLGYRPEAVLMKKDLG